jgi:hypothetical protein
VIVGFWAEGSLNCDESELFSLVLVTSLFFVSKVLSIGNSLGSSGVFFSCTKNNKANIHFLAKIRYNKYLQSRET